MNTGSDLLPDDASRLSLKDAAETIAFGRRIARMLGPGSLILLEGPLGSGKTTLAKGIYEGLGGNPDEVVSPSFTLINVYRGGRLKVCHIDLYRLDSRKAAADPDIAEVLSKRDGVTIVEWAEKLGRAASNAVRLVMGYDVAPDSGNIKTGKGRTALIAGMPEGFRLDTDE